MFCNYRSLESSRSHRITKLCRALSTRTLNRLTAIKNAIVQQEMYFTKLILAVVGISFAIASPVPQDDNDDLENCNIDCTDTAYICTNDASNSVDKAVWYVAQTISKPAVPLLSADLPVPCSISTSA